MNVMNVTVLRRKSPTSVEWDMLFQDHEFGDGNTGAVITRVQDHCECEAGDEFIIIMDGRAMRVKMVPATLEAEWSPMKRTT